MAMRCGVAAACASSSSVTGRNSVMCITPRMRSRTLEPEQVRRATEQDGPGDLAHLIAEHVVLTGRVGVPEQLADPAAVMRRGAAGAAMHRIDHAQRAVAGVDDRDPQLRLPADRPAACAEGLARIIEPLIE